MSQSADESLADLIAREQRGFRRILFAGLLTIIVMALLSAALGVYLYAASRNLADTTRTLQEQAFETRQRVDQQSNRIAAQEIAMRRIYNEIRAALGAASGGATAQNAAAAVQAARDYLLRGRVPSLEHERLIRAVAANPAAPAAAKSLLTGVAAFLDFDARGDAIASDAAAPLPAPIQAALDAFEAARRESPFATVGSAGVAWVRFRQAQAHNWPRSDCEAVFAEVAASVPDGVPSPQPLYFRAQCERKLGMTRESLVDYARALSDSAEAAGASQDAAEMFLAMNAFHGVGTTLIAAEGVGDDAPGMSAALAAAQEHCAAKPEYAARSARMALALACLDAAVALRRALKQTDNQLSGTAENISFAHLRDGDFDAAYAHATGVERTGLFAWNELVRTLTAPRAQFASRAETRAAAAAGAEARRNVSMFRVSQFNTCELEALFDAEMYAAAVTVLEETHPQDKDAVACARP